MTDQAAPPTDQPDTRLRRAVTGRLLFLFILGDVLGAGVDALAGQVAAEVGGAIWVPLLLVLLLALLTAASYAELATKYPRAGGSAVYAERAFRQPVLAFLVGYCMPAGVTSAAGLALAFAGDYPGVCLDVPAGPAALVFLLLVALLNARGIRESLRANVVMTLVEVSGLVLVVVLGALVLGRGDGDLGRTVEFPPGVAPASAVRVGLAASVVLPPDELAASTGPLLEVVRAADAGVPDWLFSAVALVAVANGALLTMIMASRMAYGMSEQRLLPAVLGRVLPHRRTPWVAIAVTTLVAMALSLVGDLTDLASTVVLLPLFVFLSTNTAVLVLRRDPVGADHFRAPTVLPVLGIASCLLLLWQQEARTRGFAVVLLLGGVVLYVATRPAERRSGAAGSAHRD